VVGARVLLRALSEGGRSDLAFLIATQTEKPGWGFWMRSGATTLWEGWNYGASLNHIMYGDVSAWFYTWLAGIQQEPDSIAFERIVFRPNPAGGLKEASGSYLSARGKVSSSWRSDGKLMNLALEQNQQRCAQRQGCQTGFFIKKNPTSQMRDRVYLC